MGNPICQKFERMGARVKVVTNPVGRESHITAPAIRLDVRRDAEGEFFELRHRKDVEVNVLEVVPRERHLLLMAREAGEDGRGVKSKYLCGHDERAWFVAAIPEAARARNVQDARDALKPAEVWDAIRRFGVSGKDRDNRRTAAFIRQGEWFFIPDRRLQVDPMKVLKNEPIRRGAGKPHLCQFVFRTGGQVVYVSTKYPQGLPAPEYARLKPAERDSLSWRQMVRNARVYAKGSVRHPDHKTVWLSCWHRVVMNTETRAAAMRHVAFLD
jgi:hypothetical protein